MACGRDRSVRQALEPIGWSTLAARSSIGRNPTSLLDLSKIEAGRMEFHLETFSFASQCPPEGRLLSPRAHVPV
jgi:hypothetical protein